MMDEVQSKEISNAPLLNTFREESLKFIFSLEKVIRT
jgi:hypothetical protein